MECKKRGIPTEVFFLYELSNPRTREGQVPQECKDACMACEFRIECLDWALTSERNGFWAMTRRMDREKLRKQLGIRLNKDPQKPPWWMKSDFD